MEISYSRICRSKEERKARAKGQEKAMPQGHWSGNSRVIMLNRCPKFNVYWIYLLIIATILGLNFLRFQETDEAINAEGDMPCSAQGDVEKWYWLRIRERLKFT